MIKLSFALFVLLRLLAGLLAEPYFISTVGRTLDSIGLQCANETRFRYINVEGDNVRFWLNKSEGVRPTQDFETDLGMRPDVTLTRNDNVARFKITPELEGHYSCGVVSETGESRESSGILLISMTRGVQYSSEFVLESGMTATIPCPIQVGKLSSCYYGRWYKDGFNIIEVGPPAAQCENPQSARSNEDRSYMLNSDFTLTIPSVTTEDSGTYECELFAINPASSTTVNYGRSVGQSLSVDEAPTFMEQPEDFVVGRDEATKTLSSTATFYCTSAGVPQPRIEWSYLASLTGQDQNLNEIADVNETVVGVDEGGRTIVRSTLAFHSLKNRDGGNVTCTAKSRVGSNPTSARLTVLGAPLDIGVIKSLDGTILYEIALPVTLNRPTHLNFTYIDSQNSNRAHSRNGESDSVLMEFNNLIKIYHREDKASLPFRKFHLNLSLYTAKGSQIIEGPFVTTSEPIDSGELPPIAVIGLAAGLVGAVLFLLPIIILLGLCCGMVYKKKRKLQDDVAEKQKDIEEQLDDADSNAHDAIKLVEREGKDVDKEAIRDRLKQIQKHIAQAKSKANDTKKLVNRTDTDCGEDLLTEALTELNELLMLLGEAPKQTPTDLEPASSMNSLSCAYEFGQIKYNSSKPIASDEVIEQV